MQLLIDNWFEREPGRETTGQRLRAEPHHQYRRANNGLNDAQQLPCVALRYNATSRILCSKTKSSSILRISPVRGCDAIPRELDHFWVLMLGVWSRFWQSNTLPEPRLPDQKRDPKILISCSCSCFVPQTPYCDTTAPLRATYPWPQNMNTVKTETKKRGLKGQLAPSRGQAGT